MPSTLSLKVWKKVKNATFQGSEHLFLISKYLQNDFLRWFLGSSFRSWPEQVNTKYAIFTWVNIMAEKHTTLLWEIPFSTTNGGLASNRCFAKRFESIMPGDIYMSDVGKRGPETSHICFRIFSSVVSPAHIHQ